MHIRTSAHQTPEFPQDRPHESECPGASRIQQSCRADGLCVAGRIARCGLFVVALGGVGALVLNSPHVVRAAQVSAAATPVPSGYPVTSPVTTGVLPTDGQVKAALKPPFVPAVTITLIDGASPSRTECVAAATVGDALAALRLTLATTDQITPQLNTVLRPGVRIAITRIRYKQITETSIIPFRTIFRMSHELPPGQVGNYSPGRNGELIKRYELTYINDKLSSRRFVGQRMAMEPVDAVTYGGIRIRMAQALPSRSGAYTRLRSVEMVATGYSPYEGSGSGRCATGMRAGYGVVAVDPRVIPLGTRLYIEGYGYAVAGDTGGAIKGHRIDLGHTTYREASAVGRRHVRVWILDQR
ncbi:MAG: 3D domain-containing protein [Capsulimonadaceae bacterium]